MAAPTLSLDTLARVVNPQSWPTTVIILAITTVLYGLAFLLQRPSLSSKAPKLFGSYPIVGSIGFFTRRGDFLEEGIKAYPSRQSLFYVGKKPVVNLAGPSGRKVFFDSKELNLPAGYAALFSLRFRYPLTLTVAIDMLPYSMAHPRSPEPPIASRA